MIADCETCDRKQVPCKSCQESQPGEMTMLAHLRPRAFDLDNPSEIRRLLVECEGFLRTCKRHHHGTDFEGRDFAIAALGKLAERYPQSPQESRDAS